MCWKPVVQEGTTARRERISHSLKRGTGHAHATQLTVVGNAPVTGLSEALGINDAGQVAGQEDSTFPIVWTPTTPNGTVGASLRLAMPPLGGGPGTGTATAINNLGDAVGFVDTLDSSGTPVTRAAFWLAGAGTVAELGTLIPSFSPPGFFLGNSRAFGINDSRVIVGVSDSPTGSEHAFVFDPTIGFMRDIGSLVPLSMLPGTPDPSSALGVNNQGDVVGEATGVDASGNLVARAFLLPAGSIFMQDLGTLVDDPNNPGLFLGDSSASPLRELDWWLAIPTPDCPWEPTAPPPFSRAAACRGVDPRDSGPQQR